MGALCFLEKKWRVNKLEITVHVRLSVCCATFEKKIENDPIHFTIQKFRVKNNYSNGFQI